MTDVRGRSLIVRLAESEKEIEMAQRLRFEVFSRTRKANFSEEAIRTRRDADEFDPFCDHLLVIDPTGDKDELSVVGTYRLMRKSQIPGSPGYYTANRFKIDCFKDFDGEVAELGRVCIDPRYKDRAVMQMLWQGVAAYINKHDVEIMFGCAGYVGTDPKDNANSLSYLHYNHLAPENLRPVAIGPDAVPIDVLKREEVDERQALKQMPSIIRGYLRLGGWIGEGASVNHLFNTTMVCIVVETKTISERYSRHFMGNMQAA